MRYSSAILSSFIGIFCVCLSGCGGGEPDVEYEINHRGSPTDEFKIYISINRENRRVEMPVTGKTTFGEVRKFAESGLSIAGRKFDLQVAGKHCADDATLEEHGMVAPAEPINMPYGNVIVRLRD